MPVDVDGGWTIPRFISEAHVTGVANVTGTFTVTTPAGMFVGDLMIMVLGTNSDTTTPAAGWTQIENDSVAATWQTFTYQKVATSTDVGVTTYNWTVAGTSAAPAWSVIAAYRDVDDTNVVVASNIQTTTTPVTTPSVTSTRPSLIVTALSNRIVSATISTFTGSGNERFDGGNHGASTSYSGAVYDSGSVSYTIGANSGNTITPSAAPANTVGLTLSLGARKINTASPMLNLTQALDRSTRW